MTAIVAQLGARVLRKLGAAIVPEGARLGMDSSNTAAGATSSTAADVAGLAVRELGVVVPDAQRPDLTAVVTPDDMASRAARAVGMNPKGPQSVGPAMTGFTDVAIRSLKKLGIIDAVEPANPADQALAIGVVGSVHDELTALGYTTWGVDAIPQSVAEWYVVLTANLLAPAFGKPSSPENYAAAQAAIRMQALSGPFGQSLAAAKVQAVQDALAAAGLVPWALSAVPQAYAEDYVTMAAVLLAPIIGKQAAPDRQVDQAAWDAAEGRIRRGVSIQGIQARALARVQAVHSEVDALNLATWDADHIPASLIDAYASMVADLLGPSMGRERDLKAYAAGMARIRAVAIGGPAGQALAEQKVCAVHAEWDARGFIPWSLFDLPDQAEEFYVLKAAVLLAPEVDAKADPAWLPMAEMGIARITAVPSRRHPVRVCYF